MKWHSRVARHRSRSWDINMVHVLFVGCSVKKAEYYYRKCRHLFFITITIDYLLWLTKSCKAGLFDNPVGVILLIGIGNDLQYIATLPEFREKYIKGDILSLFSDDGSCIVEAKTALGKRMIAVEDP